MRDDQFLVSDRSENKFYGSVHGASSHSTTGPMAGVQAAVAPSLGYLSRRLQVQYEYATRCALKPYPETRNANLVYDKILRPISRVVRKRVA